MKRVKKLHQYTDRSEMKTFQEQSTDELMQLREALEKDFAAAKERALKLDMSRGKPAPAQLDLSMGMLNILNADTTIKAQDGVDVRNYADMDGIPEAKQLMAELMGCASENVIVYNNASLSIMYDTVSRSMTHGVMGSKPWVRQEKVKFLCPVPGYDRHFSICAHFGIEMVNVPMTPNGPDMDMVEQLVSEDPSIKGIWCTPKYSNPQGIVYSSETVLRFARLRPAAPDFRIFWDNAYVVHYLDPSGPDEIPEILSECAKAGNPDMVYEFCSTSKISFAGGGISAMAASAANLADVKKSLTIQTIGSDKVNQLRHVRFFGDLQGILNHMGKHAEIIRPKFEVVFEVLDRELTGCGVGQYMRPRGGYFISFDAMEGCAKAIVAKCREAGMVLTGAGATYPYGKDPLDQNIRIAPTFPTLDEMRQAAELFALCVKLVSAQRILELREVSE
jgi:DNA-binding transcriptional MocR family regulator